MTTYIAPQTGNPYSSAVTGGFIPGDAATGHLIRFVDEYVDYLEPWDTPILTAILGSAKKRTANQLKIEHGIKRQRPMFTTLAGGAYTATGSTLNFGSTNINLVQKGMVFRIDDEIFWATADPNVSAGTIAVAYAQAGTLNDDHAQHSRVEIIGTATTLDGPTYNFSPQIYGDFHYNHPQRFQGALKFDDMAVVTPDWEKDSADRLNEAITEEAKYQKIMLNKAIIHGRRQLGDLTANSERPALMGGIPQFLTTNVHTVANNAPLSVYDVEEISSRVWQTYRKMAQKLVMSMSTKRAWNRLINPYRQGSLTDTSLNLKLDTVELETGTFEVMVDPYMPDGEIWGLDFSGFNWYVYKDHDWQVREFTDSLGAMAQAKAVLGAFSMLMPKEPLMFRITGFSTDLSHYPVGTL